MNSPNRDDYGMSWWLSFKLRWFGASSGVVWGVWGCGTPIALVQAHAEGLLARVCLNRDVPVPLV